jgi:hypothetical protein
MVSLTDDQWLQASLPVRHRGLGVQSVSMLASSALLASAAGTLNLQTLILQWSQVDSEDVSKATDHWRSIAGGQLSRQPEMVGRRSLKPDVPGVT